MNFILLAVGAGIIIFGIFILEAQDTFSKNPAGLSSLKTFGVFLLIGLLFLGLGGILPQ